MNYGYEVKRDGDWYVAIGQRLWTGSVQGARVGGYEPVVVGRAKVLKRGGLGVIHYPTPDSAPNVYEAIHEAYERDMTS